MTTYTNINMIREHKHIISRRLASARRSLAAALIGEIRDDCYLISERDRPASARWWSPRCCGTMGDGKSHWIRTDRRAAAGRLADPTQRISAILHTRTGWWEITLITHGSARCRGTIGRSHICTQRIYPRSYTLGIESTRICSSAVKRNWQHTHDRHVLLKCSVSDVLETVSAVPSTSIAL